jgi:hypothetical protein
MCLKCKEEVRNSFAPINLIDDDLGIAFVCVRVFFFCYQFIQKEFCGVLESFLSFKR